MSAPASLLLRKDHNSRAAIGKKGAVFSHKCEISCADTYYDKEHS